MPFSELTRGIEGVLALWLVGCWWLLRGTIVGLRRFRAPSLARLARDEDGVSYTLAYVLVIPLYLCFLCLVLETSLLLLAKIGTLYAAHAGARSAIVWSSAQPEAVRQERIEQATWTAMAPFVRATPTELATAGRLPPVAALRQATEFVGVYRYYTHGVGGGDDAVPSAYLLRKYLNAAGRTRVEVEVDRLASGRPVSVTVTYDAPLLLTGAQRLLPPDRRWPRQFTIVSRAILPDEAPTTPDQTLGINYHSR